QAGSEALSYRTAGLTYEPRGAPFVHVGELWLVRGIPPQLVERALPYVTVFSGLQAVHVLDAAPLALAALPGMTPELLNAVLNQRGAGPQNLNAALNQRGAGSQNGEYVLQMLGPARASATLEPSKAIRVRVGVEFPNGRRSNASVVILLAEGGDVPFRVLS